MIKRKKQIIEDILQVIQDSVFGVTVEHIANATGHHRSTIKKYLATLHELGLIVRKKVGHYHLIMASNIFESVKGDFTGMYLDILIFVLTTQLDFDEKKIRELSRRVATRFTSEVNLIRNRIKEGLSKIEISKNLTDIFIPTVAPHLKFKIRSFKTSDKLLYLEVHDLKAQVSPNDLVCEFFRGYLEGLLEAIGVNFENIEIIERTMEEGTLSCKFMIILEKPIEEVRKTVAP